MTCEIPCRLVRLVVQTGNCALDFLPRCLADVGFAVDDPRDCFYRDTRKLCDIVNRDFRHVYEPNCAVMRITPLASPELHPDLTALSIREQVGAPERHIDLAYPAAALEQFGTP